MRFFDRFRTSYLQSVNCSALGTPSLNTRFGHSDSKAPSLNSDSIPQSNKNRSVYPMPSASKVFYSMLALSALSGGRAFAPAFARSGSVPGSARRTCSSLNMADMSPSEVSAFGGVGALLCALADRGQ